MVSQENPAGASEFKLLSIEHNPSDVGGLIVGGLVGGAVIGIGASVEVFIVGAAVVGNGVGVEIISPIL